MENVRVDLAAQIRFLRDLQGYSQDSLASHLGISQQAYQKLECGKCRITEDRLVQISAFLEIEPWQIKSLNRIELMSVYEQRQEHSARLKIKKEVLSIQNQIEELKKQNEHLLRQLNNS
ncbi:MAG: hypothetical protein CMP59_07805 [Flavobacteriales bacterium]|nr:hypothetical protein [Flavobacteriales bacterium]|tara:strand:+ start:1086 stop:1442 length:357 start_codon:yes stop_codon:yes gene_type:complete